MAELLRFEVLAPKLPRGLYMHLHGNIDDEAGLKGFT